MSLRVIHFMTPSRYLSLSEEAKDKMNYAKDWLYSCLKACSKALPLEISEDNLKELKYAMLEYSNWFELYNNIEKVYLRSREHYFELKEENLLSKEELELYDSEFCDKE